MVPRRSHVAEEELAKDKSVLGSAPGGLAWADSLLDVFLRSFLLMDLDRFASIEKSPHTLVLF